MIYGYGRVSTKGQAKDGNSLEAQERLIKEHGAEVIYMDSFTGTKMTRPEFDKLLEELKAGDTLVVAKLDRFARSVYLIHQLLYFVYILLINVSGAVYPLCNLI